MSGVCCDDHQSIPLAGFMLKHTPPSIIIVVHFKPMITKLLAATIHIRISLILPHPTLPSGAGVVLCDAEVSSQCASLINQSIGHGIK